MVGNDRRDGWWATVLVKIDPLQIWDAERVRELAQRESCLQARDAVDPRCIPSPSVEFTGQSTYFIFIGGRTEPWRNGAQVGND
jgi:hypothetical protein